MEESEEPEGRWPESGTHASEAEPEPEPEADWRVRGLGGGAVVVGCSADSNTAEMLRALAQSLRTSRLQVRSAGRAACGFQCSRHAPPDAKRYTDTSSNATDVVAAYVAPSGRSAGRAAFDCVYIGSASRQFRCSLRVLHVLTARAATVYQGVISTRA